jgi:hypothetical protein
MFEGNRRILKICNYSHRWDFKEIASAIFYALRPEENCETGRIYLPFAFCHVCHSSLRPGPSCLTVNINKQQGNKGTCCHYQARSELSVTISVSKLILQLNMSSHTNPPEKLETGDSLHKPIPHNNNDQHHHDSDDHDNMPWYLPPRQRQRWGDTQHPPHTDWGDIFFDLFYVAAAYNLGGLLREDPTTRGLLYMVGCFVPINYIWSQNMVFRSRFYLLNDVYHRLFEAAVLLPLATAVWHIRGVTTLSRPSEHHDMFYYCLSIFIAQVFVIVRYLEVLVGQRMGSPHLYPESYYAAIGNIVIQVPSTCCFLAALLYTGIQYDEDVTSDLKHRNLAGSVESSSNLEALSPQDDIAIYLCIFAYASNFLAMIFYFGFYISSRSDCFKQ